ncbi:thymidine phosphorylase [Natranaerofaba carboxydovora]|uniref:thymidine phosphorylase n=1 Tax=Natranaerofaba carboxydovora TaxID=2742683 RepID=UPI001F143DCF|nr:thymidine phosphorylase [Natranaerofaba carboxydovora]UMZ73923.1 Pyrimidine-nucleoside phosphorylase [Natranaerofaba carboxydovora]
MTPYDVIFKKRMGEKLSLEELDFIVNGYNKGTIPDYQMAAFLMAAFLKGLSSKETSDLTHAIIKTGTILNLDEVEGIVVDKHSTGGVGDKTSLVLAPLLSSCGLKVAKISGRGLGHTGGTIDKLESVSGFEANLTNDEFIRAINEVGMSIIGQTEKLAPADKKIYALRDVTATVDSIPLIASSIMSKKIAAGTDIIALDIKVGKGAFMKELDKAKELAKEMISIGKSFDKKVFAVISDMNQPLGNTIGNALEVKEAVQTLEGKGPLDLQELCLTIGSYILKEADKVKDVLEGRKILLTKLKEKEGLKKFEEFFLKQGVSYCSNIFELPESETYCYVKSNLEGYISWLDSETIGKASVLLGAGRRSKEDDIDPAVGIELLKKRGDFVAKEEPVFKIHYNTSSLLVDLETIQDRLVSSYEIISQDEWARKNKEEIPLIYDIL